MSVALRIFSLMDILFLVFAFAGILLLTLWTTGNPPSNSRTKQPPTHQAAPAPASSATGLAAAPSTPTGLVGVKCDAPAAAPSTPTGQASHAAVTPQRRPPGIPPDNRRLAADAALTPQRRPPWIHPDNRRWDKVKTTRVFVCDKCEAVIRCVRRQVGGRYVDESWKGNYAVEKIGQAWWDGLIDVTWWCTRCHVEAGAGARTTGNRHTWLARRDSRGGEWSSSSVLGSSSRAPRRA